MCAAQSFSFGEYIRDLNPRQKYVIRSLVEASLACVIEEVRYWHVEEELELWSACDKGSCLPSRSGGMVDGKTVLRGSGVY